MDVLEAVRERHAVRSYSERELGADIIKKLEDKIKECNKESGLHMQLVRNEPKAFNCWKAKVAGFHGVRNYIALVGEKSFGLASNCGYYGEQVVLYAQQLGLNTCWVAGSYKYIKNAFEVKAHEVLVVLIAIGYGENQGKPHKLKKAEKFIKTNEPVPEWFNEGIKLVQYAPAAYGIQDYKFSYHNNRVKLKAPLIGSRVSRGIARYHFELGCGRKHVVELM